MTALPVSIVIPTYGRETVLLDTLRDLLGLKAPPAEIVVLDQTPQHEPATDQALNEMHSAGQIRWLRLPVPSIPSAMNRGLLEARQDIVLFLDDDIRPGADLVAAHAAAHLAHGDALIAGRVVQPWETLEPEPSERFHFNSPHPAWVGEFMGGNFSMGRATAIALGGFDENFVRVAYRFEAEFAHRWKQSGRKIYFEPAALLHHLKAGAGGTRTYGDHLRTWRPDHAVGAYYHGLRTGALREFVARPFRSIATRYHLRHPWHIPGTLIAELGGMAWALGLYLRGPRHLKPSGQSVT